MLFNLDFTNYTVWSCFFFFFLIIDLECLIPAAIAQIFNRITELVIPIGIPSKEANAEIEIHPVIVEAKIKKCSISFTFVQSFLCFLLNNSFCFISSVKQFLVSSIFFNLDFLTYHIS